MVLVMTPSAAPRGSKAVTIVNGAPEPPEKVLHALEDMQTFLDRTSAVGRQIRA